MSVVLSQRRAGNTVDVFWRGTDQSGPALSYRLVDAEPDALLCLRLSDNPALLAPDDAHVASRGDGSDLVILRLVELSRALPGLLPQRERRGAFIAALRDSLADWPVQGTAAPAARLRAACADAIARLPESSERTAGRKPAKPRSVAGIEEESQEALFRALYFCRKRADGDA